MSDKAFILITKNENGSYTVGTASEREIYGLFNDGQMFCERVRDLWPSINPPRKRHLLVEGHIVVPKQKTIFEELQPELTS